MLMPHNGFLVGWQCVIVSKTIHSGINCHIALLCGIEAI
jgi:hypothetical protein